MKQALQGGQNPPCTFLLNSKWLPTLDYSQENSDDGYYKKKVYNSTCGITYKSNQP